VNCAHITGMKRLNFLFLPAFAGIAAAGDSPRERIASNDNWRFINAPVKRHVRPDGNPGADVPYVQNDCDDSGWRKLNLPHDWAVEGPFNSGGVGGSMGRLPSPGIAWYRKQLDIPARDAGKSIFHDVDGGMAYAAVWVNGKLVGGWPFGYNSWRLDLTPYVVPGGEN